ncbi:MAG: hypothetical protein JWN52_6909 [Actinomycetia bacterium]|nr:hypothetical protein [Actinomycetes bacterium]
MTNTERYYPLKFPLNQASEAHRSIETPAEASGILLTVRD